MWRAARPSSWLSLCQPSRSYPASVAISRRTSLVGDRASRARLTVLRNSSCSAEKLKRMNSPPTSFEANLFAAICPGMTVRTSLWQRDRAVEQARLAAQRGEVPIGAVIVAPDGAVLAEAGNRPEADRDPTAHAEMLAI